MTSWLRSTILASVLALAPFGAMAAERSPHANFILRCAGCHALDGSGHPVGGIPDFRGLVGAFATDEATRAYLAHVPGVIGASLSDAEIAAVLNYIMETWAGTSLPDPYMAFTADEIAVLRAKDVGDVVSYRRELVEDLTAHGIKTAEYPWP